MILYDIHTHHIKEYRDYKVISVLNTSPADFLIQKEKQIQDVLFSCGIHPWDAGLDQVALVRLAELVDDPAIVAIGEVGLDKSKGASMDIQTKVFRAQIELAGQKNIPLIIHCVKAWDELIALHKEYKPLNPWILHGFRGKPEQVKQLAAFGFKFSIGEYFNKQAIAHIPLNSLFLETDMLQVSICDIYRAVSSVLWMDDKLFADIVAENVRICFDKKTK